LLVGAVVAFAVAILETINYWSDISILACMVFIIVIAGVFFQSSLKRNNCTHFFTLPVTAGEKFFHAIVVLIILMIVLQVMLIAGTYAGYLIRPVFNNVENPSVVDEISVLKLTVLPIEGYLFFAAVVATFLFGSVYFKKNAFLKTLAIGAGSFIGIALLYNPLLLFIAFGSSNPFTGGGYSYAITGKVQMLDFPFYEPYTWLVLSAIALFFLSLTCLRLKETEV
jgi:hypothetical protein